MFVHNNVLKAGSTTFVAVNATNKFVASASIDGNITIRSMEEFNSLYNNVKFEKQDIIGRTTTESTKYTIPSREVSKTPEFQPNLLESIQKPVNTVGVRSRSKITSLKYANLSSNSNLLAAVYKNGEVYVIANPQDVNKCRIQQIFKHSNGLILDFAWSADDQLMAFTSMNNEIIIYDIIYGKIITILYIHKNTVVKNGNDESSTEEISTPVKGIAFDKLGSNHIFTMGDDKVLNVIKYELVRDEVLGRKFEYQIVQEYENVIQSAKLNKTSIKKLSLSPDDNLLAIPNTAKNKMTRISILDQDKTTQKWKISTIFSAIGFKSIMVAFSPCVYKNKDGVNFYVLASSSNDNTISIWRTDTPKPVYVSIDILQNVQDFCWSIDGTKLFLAHQNSQMSIAVFESAQFGPPVFKIGELTEPLLTKTNNLLPLEFDSMTKWRLYAKNHPILVEQTQKEVQAKELSKLKKIYIVGKIDKREDQQAATPVPSSTSASTPSHIEEKQLAPKLTKNTPIAPKLAPNTQTITPATKEAEKLANFPPIKPKEPETTSNSNLKKISVGNEKEKDNGREKNDKRKEKPIEIETSKKRPVPVSNYDLPSNSVPKDLNTKVAKIAKRDITTANGTTQTPVNSKRKRDNEPVEFVGSVIINPQISFSNIRIAVPKIKMNISYKLIDNDSLHLHVKNGNGTESQPSKITLVNEIPKMESKQLFTDFIPQKVHIVSGSSKYIALSTPNGQIITYSETGRRILPVIVLGSPLSFLELRDNYLLAVTSVGELYVWDLELKKALISSVSLYPVLYPLYASGQSSSTAVTNNANEIVDSNVNVESNSLVFVNGDILTRSENLTICSITSQGIPIVTLSNGNGYLFNKEMKTWSLISDSWWAFGSQYWDSTLSLDQTKDVGVLELLESHTNEEINRKGKAKFFTKISKIMLMREGYENMETIISLNHLENKINFYLMLGDYKNYKTFLIMYTKRLSELNMKGRLLEILDKLFQDRNGKVCGHSKHDLLEELILSCSKYREVQHILVQFSESIGLLKIEEDSDFEIL